MKHKEYTELTVKKFGKTIKIKTRERAGYEDYGETIINIDGRTYELDGEYLYIHDKDLVTSEYKFDIKSELFYEDSFPEGFYPY